MKHWLSAIVAAVVGVLALTSCAGRIQTSKTSPAAPPLVDKDQKAASGFNEYTTPGVIVLAFPMGGDLSPLFKTEMAILRAASRSGPVLVLTLDAFTRARIRTACGEGVTICAELQTGKIRLVDSNYDTPWVRDYGPQFTFGVDGGLRVVDANYRNNRSDDVLESRRAQVIQERRDVLEDLKRAVDDWVLAAGSDAADTKSDSSEKADDTDDDRSGDREGDTGLDERFTPLRHATRSSFIFQKRSKVESAGEELHRREREQLERERAEQQEKREKEKQAKRDAIEAGQEKLRLLQDEDELLRERLESTDRALDDRAPFQIAQRALRVGFSVDYVSAYVDGGNLLRLTDGGCITTEDLLRRNAAVGSFGSSVKEVLQKTYGCKKVVFLRSLPGDGVIEHVDMFAMPVSGAVLLANYDPTQPVLEKYITQIDENVRSVMLDAAVAMDENEKRLREANIRVVRVPALLPQVAGEAIVYRTLLNGLVRVGADSQAHAILPRYDGYENDVQDAAKTIIEGFFQPDAVDYVESTVSANGQGAVHCLTLVAPFAGSVFEDNYGQMQELLTAASAADLFHGIWQADEQSRHPHWRFFITDGQITALDKGRQVAQWTTTKEEKRDETTYAIASEDGALHFVFNIIDPSHMKMKVISKRSKDAVVEVLQRVGHE